jgi:hypothetical protein
MALAVGSAGEHIVQARLLVRGWTTGNVNTGGMMNAPAVDLLAAKGSQNMRIAVKTTGHGGANAQWSVKEDWATTTLFKGDVRPDFVIFVWFNHREMLDACRIFVVPADVVESALRESHEHWHRYMRRDGLPRKKSTHAAFTWTGKPTAEISGAGLRRGGRSMRTRGSYWKRNHPHEARRSGHPVEARGGIAAGVVHPATERRALAIMSRCDPIWPTPCKSI